MAHDGATQEDHRFMAAAIRLSRRSLGLTGRNPSVGALIVSGGVIVGSGVTAPGGRPHAEPQALAEAGARARGATVYVTLEPCAHHGKTPPCAEALVAAGVARVVGAAGDPDPRVGGKGYALLRSAGIEVVETILAGEASDLLAGYLTRSVKNRPEVTLKLAVSADGMIGRSGQGQVAITGEIARRQVHLMRAEADAILVGVNTAIGDDPELTCRLPGLEARSPIRIVLDPQARLPLASRLVSTAQTVPLLVVAHPGTADLARMAALKERGVDVLAARLHAGRIDLASLLEDLAGRGISSLIVEGGARTASVFLTENLVDRIALFGGPAEIGGDGIASPLPREASPAGFRENRREQFGPDTYREWVRKTTCSQAS